jgi:hypothetical protein
MRLRAAGLAVLCFSLPLRAQSGAAQLHPGDRFPQLSGPALTGLLLTLPAAARGGPAVVVVSFSRAGGRDARRWSEKLAADEPHWPVYTVIFLESVPSMFRGLALSGIRSGVPAAQQSRTLVREQDQARWEQWLGVNDTSRAWVVLLGPQEHLRWISSGPFSAAEYSQLKAEARSLR